MQSVIDIQKNTVYYVHLLNDNLHNELDQGFMIRSDAEPCIMLHFKTAASLIKHLQIQKLNAVVAQSWFHKLIWKQHIRGVATPLETFFAVAKEVCQSFKLC